MLYNYNLYILNEASKEEKIKSKILKWFSVEYIVDKAINLHPKLAIWIVNQTINQTAKISEKDLKDTKNSDIQKIFIETWNQVISNDMAYIMDWVKSYGITTEDKQNFTKFTYDEALNKSKEWHDSLKAGGELNIEVEEGKILIQFPDGFYWVDLETNNSRDEADCMGHCGNTNMGDTIYSLRRKHTNGKISCHITAAIDSFDGIVYQMKGKNNTKPVNKYHRYIVELLIDDELGLKGFGREYLIEEDFSPDDLNSELRSILLDKRPDIDTPIFSDDDINQMFGRFLENYYGFDEEYGFRSVEWVYELYDYKTVIDALDNRSDSFAKILFKEFHYKIRNKITSNQIKFDIKTYVDIISTHVPADKYAKIFNIEIDENKPAIDNWDIIANEIGIEELRKIAKDYNIFYYDEIENSFKSTEEKWGRKYVEWDYDGLLNFIFSNLDEKGKMKELEKLFGYDHNNQEKDGKYYDDVVDVWDTDDLHYNIEQKFTTKEKKEEMESVDYHELNWDY